MDKFKTYWDNICKIYFLTKHYLILSEEISDDFDTFLQPIKEHRDAFDHIARVYGYHPLNIKRRYITLWSTVRRARWAENTHLTFACCCCRAHRSCFACGHCVPLQQIKNGICHITSINGSAHTGNCFRYAPIHVF